MAARQFHGATQSSLRAIADAGPARGGPTKGCRQVAFHGARFVVEVSARGEGSTQIIAARQEGLSPDGDRSAAAPAATRPLAS